LYFYKNNIQKKCEKVNAILQKNKRTPKKEGSFVKKFILCTCWRTKQRKSFYEWRKKRAMEFL